MTRGDCFSNKTKTLMSEQLLKFGYISYYLKGEYISKYLLISGAILTIDFDDFFFQVKEL